LFLHRKRALEKYATRHTAEIKGAIKIFRKNKDSDTVKLLEGMLKKSAYKINSIFFFNSGVNSLSLITIAEVPVLRFNLYFLEPMVLVTSTKANRYFGS
jgi:hypothetical protein